MCERDERGVAELPFLTERPTIPPSSSVFEQRSASPARPFPAPLASPTLLLFAIPLTEYPATLQISPLTLARSPRRHFFPATSSAGEQCPHGRQLHTCDWPSQHCLNPAYSIQRYRLHSLITHHHHVTSPPQNTYPPSQQHTFKPPGHTVLHTPWP